MTPELLVPDWPAPPAVSAGVSTRRGGISSGCWDSLNLGDACGDDPDAVAENRRRLGRSLPAPPYWLRQVHGCRVVTHGAAGHLPEADAVVTRERGRVCAVLTADCLPVLMCNRQGSWVGAAHAGWRGLSSGVLEATVAAYQGSPSDLIAWLGPGIGPAVYEVGAEVRQAFMHTDQAAAEAFVRCGNRWLADLYHLARMRLLATGVQDIDGGGFCTYSDSGRFYSFRRDGVTGRMASLIWLR
jgi:YfiH family protein